MNIEQRPAHTGNYTAGRTAPIDRVVIHVADGSYAGTLAWFADPKCDTSAHYTIAADGRVGQSVNERATAWHSGDWAMNCRSVGIEHEGRQNLTNPWQPSASQLEASAQLVADICRRWSIPVDRAHIIGHNEVNPDRAARKNCPGTGWPWAAFIERVRALTNADVPAHLPSVKDDRTLRLFNPETNLQIGTVTLIGGTDKAYIPPDVLASLRK
ncbi:N-acetylmuramoyl-L-alanine amidase [Deinococcus sp. Leaf326]|uniref:N-acetylmuramoyl-L-alanine amidase n=1 Tax=Deinococcus sp. Leaf326 TaxID=1736338 RepID=UPI0006F6C046|nr:peptidoglycan recognition family protein [Deinococcus sp. Leaf326]KQR22856.1 negative regulator of beta-lactamase [Deinococcus sp. Leaf326]